VAQKIYVGIDNGLDGGIAFVNERGKLLYAAPLPTISDGKKRKLSAKHLRALLSASRSHINCCDLPLCCCEKSVVVERPAGSKSVIAAVSMSDSFARIETVLDLGEMRRHFITAKTWQKEFWTVPQMPKDRKFDTKAAALMAATRLWPCDSWLASPRCRVPHDGMVDAALIAEYARRKGL
jgi:hypothetical protein